VSKKNEQQTQHIVRVKGENYKRFKVIEIRPNRHGVTQISGGNGQGKTTFFDIITTTLAPGKSTRKSIIRQGDRKAVGEVEFDTGYIVNREIHESGYDALSIVHKATNTVVANPMQWLQDLSAGYGFDPLEFMRLKGEDQFNQIKGLVKLDIDLADYEQRNLDDRAKQTRLNDDAKRLAAQRDGVIVDRNLPAQPPDVEKLLADAREASQYNAEIQEEQRDRAAYENTVREAAEEYTSNEDRLVKLYAEIALLESAQKKGDEALKAGRARMESWKPLPELKDRAELDAKVAQAISERDRITSNNHRREQYDRLDREATQAKDQHEAVKNAIRARKLAIAKAFETAKFPIDGLSFEIEEESPDGRMLKNARKVVTYHGVPLEECSSAEQIRISTAIGMSANPNMKVLLIREGSLLDASGIDTLEQMAQEHGYQIFAEVVDETGKVGIYLEDGEVKAINNPEPEPAPATPAKKATPRKKKETAK